MQHAHCHRPLPVKPIGGPPYTWDRIPLPGTEHRLSKVQEAFLEAGADFHSKKYEHEICTVFRNALQFFDDRCFTRITQKAIRSFIDDGLRRGLSPGAIQYQINVLHSGINWYLRDHGFDLPNPFNRIRVPGLKAGRITKQPISAQRLDELKSLCYAKDDDIRWMLALLIDTGARSSEVGGLALSDLHINGQTPFLTIQPHPWRVLKSRFSPRRIPLVGAALWAAKQLVGCATPGQIYAFPRYIKGGMLTQTPHKTLRNWLQLRGFFDGIHTIRSTFVHRLRVAGCDPEVRSAILGIKKHWAYGNYGFGYSLEFLRQRLVAIVDVAAVIDMPVPKSLGYDRVMSPYQCALAVMNLISSLAHPSFQNMVHAGVLESVDVVRGLRHGRRHGSIIFREHSYKHGTYCLTGVALPVTPQGLRSKCRKKSPHEAKIYLKERRRSKPPVTMHEAGCFPFPSFTRAWWFGDLPHYNTAGFGYLSLI